MGQLVLEFLKKERIEDKNFQNSNFEKVKSVSKREKESGWSVIIWNQVDDGDTTRDQKVVLVVFEKSLYKLPLFSPALLACNL